VLTRTSNFIDQRQIKNLLKGINHSIKIGRPPNLFVTINFVHTGCSPQAASKCFEKMRVSHFRPWLAYQTKRGRLNFGRPTYAWVIENGGGHTGAHWLVHVPERLQADFKKKLPKWLETCAGPVNSPQALDIQKAPTPEKAGLYMAKGINPRYAKLWRIRFPRPQGLVYGKRCGISANLGPAARERFNMKKAAA
jgi:hypothetical protein